MGTGIFGFLKVLDGISDKDLVNIDIKKCIRYLNKHSSCSRCQENCPTGAIRLDGQDIRIDGFLCTGCGICLNVCPNPVFSLKDIEPGTVVKAAKDSELITICCSGKGTSLQVPCLGFLNEAVLLQMASINKEVVLNMSACQMCDYSTAREIILGHIDAANSVLQCFLVKRQIKVKDDDTAIKPEHESFTRKFITHFSDRKPCYGYSRQSMFIDALKTLGPASLKVMDAGNLPFGTIEVRSSCNGCGICVAVCPMDAITIEKNDDFLLMFKPFLCTGCGLCSQLCPEGSLCPGTDIDLDVLFREKTTKVIQIKRVKCKECATLFVPSYEQLLCASCKKNKDIEDSFFSHKQQ
ncbi:MAG: 4Fe-4S dicluster domain-containing protein [ANME-2 cluster archaeon]|nr:4Fe-4S dicluster domain-containing protein [ANME-2 cluster archaeon]